MIAHGRNEEARLDVCWRRKFMSVFVERSLANFPSILVKSYSTKRSHLFFLAYFREIRSHKILTFFEKKKEFRENPFRVSYT